MYICDECGGLFEELATYKENHGEHFGYPAIETVYCSPCCHADYDEITGECDE